MSEKVIPKTEMKNILPMYEAIPDGNGPFPTIVLFVHAHGIDDSSKKVCNDLAKAGYYAVAMDPYLNEKYDFQSRSDGLIFKSYEVAHYWLQKQELADMDRLGIIGFCMGGRHVYLANAYYDDIKAVVSYYGFPHRGNEESTPQDKIDQFTAPVLSIFGSEDGGIPINAVDAYREVSSQSELDHETVVFEGAGHGFLNHNSRNYHEEAAKEAWKKTISFFDELLK